MTSLITITTSLRRQQKWHNYSHKSFKKTLVGSKKMSLQPIIFQLFSIYFLQKTNVVPSCTVWRDFLFPDDSGTNILDDNLHVLINTANSFLRNYSITFVVRKFSDIIHPVWCSGMVNPKAAPLIWLCLYESRRILVNCFATVCLSQRLCGIIGRTNLRSLPGRHSSIWIQTA